jgi:REP element-mobilizing transposase RayT
LTESARLYEFDVYAYCFMPDPLHLLAGGRSDNSYLIDFVKDFKQRTGYWFRNVRRGLKASPTVLWQRSYHDHILRSTEATRETAEYVLFNPVAAGLVSSPDEYPYSGSLVWPELHTNLR